jgi:hypothetical protein
MGRENQTNRGYYSDEASYDAPHDYRYSHANKEKISLRHKSPSFVLRVLLAFVSLASIIFLYLTYHMTQVYLYSNEDGTGYNYTLVLCLFICFCLSTIFIVLVNILFYLKRQKH